MIGIESGLYLEEVWYDSIWEKLHNMQERTCSCYGAGLESVHAQQG